MDECLDGEQRQAGLGFVEYLKLVKMTPHWTNRNAWDVKYKGRGVCRIYVWDSSWLIRPSFNYDYDSALFAFLAGEKQQEIIWGNIGFCRACHKIPCAVKSINVMGKEFKNVCSCVLFQFQDPDTATIECAKKLIGYRRAAIAVRTA